MNQTDNSVHLGERVRHIKPQIAKEYSKSLYMGKPDLSILEEGFENGAKFYEQQDEIEDRKNQHGNDIIH